VSEKNYYCQKCGHNHRYTSKIGKKHLQYKTISHNVPRKPAKVQENVQSVYEPEQTTPIINKEKSNWISLFVQDYRASYRKGVEKFGVWWTIFQFSLWSLALIFILTALIIFVVYLPKVEMLYWYLI
jgi:hypothetical protein